jgi:hypothetical protein
MIQEERETITRIMDAAERKITAIQQQQQIHSWPQETNMMYRFWQVLIAISFTSGCGSMSSTMTEISNSSSSNAGSKISIPVTEVIRIQF